MRKLGEQWVEEIDGQEHMVKLMEGNANRIHICNGCAFRNEYKNLCEIHGGVKHISEVGCARQHLIIKDLGVLNEDGCLPNCWGEYPVIECHSEVVVLWYCRTYGNVRCITAGCSTKQEAIDAWNRRV